jgi:hypothetical protein
VKARGITEGVQVTNTAAPHTSLSQASLFAVDQPAHTAGQYRLIPSVWDGEDCDLLELMLDFYPRQPPQQILDATVNAGRFWRGSQRPVIGMDINPRFHPQVVGDNLSMPFRDEVFDVVVYDPPHIPNQGKDRIKDFNTRFGLVLKSSAEHGYNFSHLFSPFICEAYRVLKSEGILFCKIADYIHNHRLQWALLTLSKQPMGWGFVDVIVL